MQNLMDIFFLEKKKMIEIAEQKDSENQKLLLEIERLKANLTQQS